MAAKKPVTQNKKLALSIHQQPEYKSPLSEIKQKLKVSQLGAMIAVNQQLLQFY